MNSVQIPHKRKPSTPQTQPQITPSADTTLQGSNGEPSGRERSPRHGVELTMLGELLDRYIPIELETAVSDLYCLGRLIRQNPLFKKEADACEALDAALALLTSAREEAKAQ